MNYKYTIAYLGQKKNQEYLANLVNIRGYENYTPEAIDALKKMFDEGKIDSYPQKIEGVNVVEWKKSPANGLHRLGELPARESPDHIEYFVDGQNYRANGPARISAVNGYIEWYLGKGCVAFCKKADHPNSGPQFNVYDGSSHNGRATDREGYAKFVKDRFPSVGWRLFFEDWVNEI